MSWCIVLSREVPLRPHWIRGVGIILKRKAQDNMLRNCVNFFSGNRRFDIVTGVICSEQPTYQNDGNPVCPGFTQADGCEFLWQCFL